MNLKDKKETTISSAKAQKKGAIVSDNIGNYEAHPFFVKKAASAKALLLKVGLPKQLTKKNQL